MSDTTDLERLVRERYGRLLAYARLLQPELADAEDAVHEAILATFGRRRSFPTLDHCEAYVRRAIATRTIDEHRRRARHRRLLVTLRSDADADVPGPAESHADRSQLADAMATLSPRERACVALRFVEHLSTAETAAQLGLAQGTVKRYVSDGVAKLNAALGTSDEAVELVDIRTVRRGS